MLRCYSKGCFSDAPTPHKPKKKQTSLKNFTIIREYYNIRKMRRDFVQLFDEKIIIENAKPVLIINKELKKELRLESIYLYKEYYKLQITETDIKHFNDFNNIICIDEKGDYYEVFFKYGEYKTYVANKQSYCPECYCISAQMYRKIKKIR